MQSCRKCCAPAQCDTSTLVFIFAVLFEDPNNYGVNESAWRKAKDMYFSCIETGMLYPFHPKLLGLPAPRL